MSRVIGIIGDENQGYFLANIINILSMSKRKLSNAETDHWDKVSIKKKSRDLLNLVTGSLVDCKTEEGRSYIGFNRVRDSIRENFGSATELSTILKGIKHGQNTVIIGVENEVEIEKIRNHSEGVIVSIDEHSDLNNFADLELFNVGDERKLRKEVLSECLNNKELSKLI